MAGIPFHAADAYVGKLLAAGRKVAICDQQEAARPGKLVRRQVTRILSAGHDPRRQPARGRAQSLPGRGRARPVRPARGVARPVDRGVQGGDRSQDRESPAGSHRPRSGRAARRRGRNRALAPGPARGHGPPRPPRPSPRGGCARSCPPLSSRRPSGAQAVMAALGVLNLQGFGLDADSSGTGAGGRADRLRDGEPLRQARESARASRSTAAARTLLLDPATLRNLEIFASGRGGREGSLLAADRPHGHGRRRPAARTLARRPDPGAGGDPAAPGAGRRTARPARPPRRAAGALSARCGTFPGSWAGCRTACAIPVNWEACGTPCGQLPGLRAALAAFGADDRRSPPWPAACRNWPPLRAALDAALADELPADLEDGGCIRAGHDAELDRLRALTSGNRAWLADLERAEQERTGIRSLKVRFTNNFGYYIEVTKANLHLVPGRLRPAPDHRRRRALRDRVPAAKGKGDLPRRGERPGPGNGALPRPGGGRPGRVDRAGAGRRDPGGGGCPGAAGPSWPATGTTAARARRERASCEIADGRHPVVEQMLRTPRGAARRGRSRLSCPTTRVLAGDDAQIALITGPNMAGKSTYIRQVALIALLAQIGCWVPAQRCRLGPGRPDFSRVGASDDLAHGNSTFMVEMNETANILNHATDRSLIILDEIGRGTSTYDGLSIAWAVVEHLHRGPERGPADALRHPLPGAHPAGEAPAPPAQFLRGREGMERGDRLRPPGRAGRRRPQLRHPGRAPGRPAAQRHRPGAGDPLPAGERRGGGLDARPGRLGRKENHGRAGRGRTPSCRCC